MPHFPPLLLMLLPLLWQLLQSGLDLLGANPVEHWLRFTGDWALWLLLLTLSISPLRRLLSIPTWASWRRLFGLASFFYASLHLAIYLLFERGLAWTEILQDLRKRPFILVGFLAFVLLLPLAITSSRSWMRRLGGAWQRWHTLIYPASLLVILHFFLLTRTDWRTPLLHGLLLLVLLAWRLPRMRPFLSFHCSDSKGVV
ncbi:sulfite oxidase heme-binding subunit YedZ [Candidatus Magnetaquicoccus inordinatus]|uniref:sulfite oxidase heme-binding subunit YedZ n=1 Tax=Candidatus Magnetaquicoccus inordinatus TaxID=2496818 RepID=UPI00102BB220|nr:protein-methionine-sulfoxide reductase heme-binding subunit MsrQ [Candidatus Magnetaquicoccus inordinatus]